tara:strand:+ start:427 stop:546 length:120 start_codon:yes stop_codon:yes gene_type:complete
MRLRQAREIARNETLLIRIIAPLSHIKEANDLVIFSFLI